MTRTRNKTVQQAFFFISTFIFLFVTACIVPLTVFAQSERSVPFTWDNATVYFVLTDRFYDGNPANNHSYGRELDRNGKPYPGYQNKPGTFHGGDLRGLTKKMKEGYFTKLGVNAIWITSPLEQIHGWVGGLNFRHYAYHGYYALDFTELDQNMGTREDLRNFIDTAHSQGIRVLFDVVMNHAGYQDMKTMDTYQFGALNQGWESFYFDKPDSEAHYDAYSRYINKSNGERWAQWWGSDWLRLPNGFSGYDVCNGGEQTACLADLPDFKTDSNKQVELPKFFDKKWDDAKMAKEKQELDAFFKRTGKPRTVTNHMIKWITDWVREFGVDGFRIDTAKHVQLSAWKDLKEESVLALREWKKKNPDKKVDDLDFWMVGELWGHGLSKNQYFSEGKFDALINFSFKDAPNNMNNIDGIFSQYARELNQDSSFNVLSYISSHDTSLYNRNNLVNAGTALLLAPGAVQIYYGDESGRKPDNSPWDQPTRTQMNWDSVDERVLNHWQKIGQFRNRHAAVGAGTHQKIQDSPYAFSRVYKVGQSEDRVVVALGAKGKANLQVGTVFSDGTLLVDAYTGREVEVVDGQVSITAHENGVVLLGAAMGEPLAPLKKTKTDVAPIQNEVKPVMNSTSDAVSSGVTVFFKKPKHWAEVQLYYYGAQPESVRGVSWGEAPTMKSVGDDWYSYTIEGVQQAYIMFKDRKGNQIPRKNQPGFMRERSGSYDGKEWTETVPSSAKISSEPKTSDQKLAGNPVIKTEPAPKMPTAPSASKVTGTAPKPAPSLKQSMPKPQPVKANKVAPAFKKVERPSSPSKLFFTDEATNSIVLRWTPAHDNVRVVAYHVFRDDKLHAYIPGKTFFKDIRLTAGKKYTYRLQAVDNEGNVSDFSKDIQRTHAN